MFYWVFEGEPFVYAILGCAGVLLLYLWWTLRKRPWLYALTGVAVLAGLYFLLDRTVETHREQIERKVRAMAKAVQARDAEAIFLHIADGFLLNGADKAAFRNRVEQVLDRRLVEEVEVWDFVIPEDVPDPEAPPGRESIRIFLRAKPKGGFVGREIPYLCRMRFVLDPDGQWRMQWLQVSDPVGDQTLPIPHLGR